MRALRPRAPAEKEKKCATVLRCTCSIYKIIIRCVICRHCTFIEWIIQQHIRFMREFFFVSRTSNSIPLPGNTDAMPSLLSPETRAVFGTQPHYFDERE